MEPAPVLILNSGGNAVNTSMPLNTRSHASSSLTGRPVVTQTTRITYRQDWPVYNAAQTHERGHFLELLRGLCDGIVQPPQALGRPRSLLADVVFSLICKVYAMRSGRRSMSDLRGEDLKRFLGKVPHYNSVFRCLEDPNLTPLLKTLIEESATPLKAVETDFAVDSSGFPPRPWSIGTTNATDAIGTSGAG
jgi:hypothetical protein